MNIKNLKFQLQNVEFQKEKFEFGKKSYILYQISTRFLHVARAPTLLDELAGTPLDSKGTGSSSRTEPERL